MKPRKKILTRNSSLFALLIGGVVFFTGCKKDTSAENPNPTVPESSALAGDDSSAVSALAVVANEGFGSQAVGGSNSSTVYHVTNLNSSGSGSLNGGIGSNKTIVFDVSGTIQTTLYFANISYLTIDATGQSITINGNNNGDAISFDGQNTHHCILKGVHVTNAGGDGINVVSGAHDIMITNCTSYGNRDGNIDVAGDNSGLTKNVTVQWCIIGGGAANSPDYSGSTLVTGQSVSIHHNLYVPASSGNVGERCPLVHCNYSPVGSPNADIRNNIIWKFGRDNGTGSGFGIDVAYGAAGNAINNYVYTTGGGASNGVTTSAYGEPSGSLYASGNVSGNSGTNANSKSNHAIYAIASQYAVTTQEACTAASMVLASAGPSPRNSTDQGYVNGVSLTGCSVTPPVNQSPTVNAGSNKTITLPANSVTLTGTASDPDGTIASYAWTKTSGPAATIASPSSASTNVTGLTAGSYVFNLKVTDNAGATANSSVTVTVNTSNPTNQSPVVNAGSSQTITLPVSSVTLSGSATDADGTIASYLWTKVSGSGGIIANPNSASTSVTGLSAGSYVFNLKATDNAGASGNQNVTITVNSGTQNGGYGTLSFSEGYDVASSVNTTRGRRNAVSFATFKTGPGSFQSEVRAGDASLSGGFRSEMPYTGTSQNPTEGVVEYDVYFQNWSGLDGGGGTITWVPKTSGAGAIVSLQNYGGKFDVVRAIGSTVTHQSGTLMTCASNTWYKMRWEYKWSAGTDGYIRLYINDALYYTFTGKTADGSGQSLTVGQMRWPNSGSTMQTTSVCYYDNLKIYTK